MFCNQCGTEIAAGSNLCPNCARTLNPIATTPMPSRLERHLRTLGILWMIGSALLLIPAVVLMMVGSLVHFSIPGTEQAARIIAPFALFVIGAIFALVSSCGIFVGWGLMKHHYWARIAGIVLGVMVLCAASTCVAASRRSSTASVCVASASSGDCARTV